MLEIEGFQGWFRVGFIRVVQVFGVFQYREAGCGSDDIYFGFSLKFRFFEFWVDYLIRCLVEGIGFFFILVCVKVRRFDFFFFLGFDWGRQYR